MFTARFARGRAPWTSARHAVDCPLVRKEFGVHGAEHPGEQGGSPPMACLRPFPPEVFTDVGYTDIIGERLAISSVKLLAGVFVKTLASCLRVAAPWAEISTSGLHPDAPKGRNSRQRAPQAQSEAFSITPLPRLFSPSRPSGTVQPVDRLLEGKNL